MVSRLRGCKSHCRDEMIPNNVREKSSATTELSGTHVIPVGIDAPPGSAFFPSHAFLFDTEDASRLRILPPHRQIGAWHNVHTFVLTTRLVRNAAGSLVRKSSSRYRDLLTQVRTPPQG